MKITTEQAAKLARQIRERFGLKIAKAVIGTTIPAKFLAGLISVEAGKDKHGQISETATRFEPGVFAKLQQVRDGKRSQWSGIKLADIGDSADLALRALATSYGLTQVMGWHCIHNLDCTVADLRDPVQHLKYAVKLLLLNSMDGDFERKEYAGEFREWNSGNEKGKTYDPDYVFNSGSVMDAYAELEAEPLVDPVEIRDQLVEPKIEDAKSGEPAPDVPAEAGQAVVGGRPEDPPKVVTKGSTPTRIAVSGGAILAFLTSVWQYISGHPNAAVTGIICLTILIVIFVLRQVILDYVRLQLGGDPSKYNVR